jgi:RND family efflux transporter MFP subunit
MNTRMRLLPAPLAVGLALLMTGCSEAPQAPVLPPLPKLETLVVSDASATNGRAWEGVVEAVQHSDLTAQTSGRVTEVLADVNDRVESGAILVRLSEVEQRAGVNVARAQVRAAEANAAEAQANYARQVELRNRKLIAQALLDQAKAARDSAIAARDAARAQQAQAAQQTDYTVVRAPFAGIVAKRWVEPGESVAPGQALISLYSPGAMRIEVQVPQSDAVAVRAANRASVVLADGSRLEPAAMMVFPAADPASHSVSVRVTLPELAQPPPPGVTAQVWFPIGTDAKYVQIPRSVVVQRGEFSAAYVLDGNRLSLRQLRLGRVLGAEVEVLAGLKPGESVVTDPVAALQAQSAQRKAAGDSND